MARARKGKAFQTGIISQPAPFWRFDNSNHRDFIMHTIASTPVFNSVRSLIFERQSITRDKLRRASGTTARALDHVVDQLVARGCIEQNMRRTAGRPVILYELPHSDSFWGIVA